METITNKSQRDIYLENGLIRVWDEHFSEYCDVTPEAIHRQPRRFYEIGTAWEQMIHENFSLPWGPNRETVGVFLPQP